MILEKLDRVPEDNDEVTLEDGTMLKICGMDDHRIKQILMVLPEKIIPKAPESDNASD